MSWTVPEEIVGCSKMPSSKAAAREEARRTLRYVEPLSDARTMLAGFFNSLLGRFGGPPAEPDIQQFLQQIFIRIAVFFR